jgi:hypothetical protein
MKQDGKSMCSLDKYNLQQVGTLVGIKSQKQQFCCVIFFCNDFIAPHPNLHYSFYKIKKKHILNKLLQLIEQFKENIPWADGILRLYMGKRKPNNL